MQRVGVSGLVMNDDRVLLLKRSAKESFLPGYFDLPGGKMDFGESPGHAVIRETREESGLDVEVAGIYNVWHWTSVYRGEPTQFVSISYALKCAIPSEITLAPAFDDYVWAGRDDLAQLQMTNELIADVLKGLAWVTGERTRLD